MSTLDLIRAGAVCVALVISNLACAADLHLPREERASAWFAPVLLIKNRPMCAAALEAERDTFFNPLDQEPKIPGLTPLMPTENAVAEDPDVEVLETYPIELRLTLPDRSRAFLRYFGYPGCGGACESAAVGIDGERMVEEPPGVLPRADRYGPDRWRLFKASDGEFYLRGTVEDHAQWHRIAAADRWELACDIALKPDPRGAQRAMYSPEVLDAIESLRVAADRMAGGAGSCGSMGTPWRWAQHRAEALQTALYRPWSVVENHSGYQSENSGGDYARIIVQLELWSLGGLMEHRDFAAYQAQFDRTHASIAKFYREKFGWSVARAEETADAALKGSISRGFGFYMYEPYAGAGEQELRRAILSRAPIAKIREIAFDAKAISRESQDSVLNIAIEYPEALSYLLEKGLDPNVGNAFGKTPLMYAAQYNRADVAEMLLKAGADPNATTHLPEDTCEYTISTDSMTPLHYAVRYSSANFIRLLLKHGAVTFIQSVRDGGAAEYPLQTLEKYAGVGVKEERNPHLADSEVAALMQALAVPSNEQKLAMATDLVARARSEYSGGNAQKAYQHLRLALRAQPDRTDALADLPLIALRAGYIGAAVAAADRATRDLKDTSALAASWFNKGLICERPEARNVYVEGARCEVDVMEPFIRSWKMQPSAARANKLRALIQKSSASCVAADQQRQYKMSPLSFGAFRVYALHRAGDKIDPASVRWSNKLALLTRAKVIETLDLGSEAVTILEVPHEPGTGGAIVRKVSISIDTHDCGEIQL